MSTYLLVNAAIISVPLLLSFEPRIRYVSKWKRVFGSIVIVGVPFILWNIIVSSIGHWRWNPDHVAGMTILTLPIEEWMFFITVPFSSLFIFEAMNVLRTDRNVNIGRIWFIFAAAVFGMAAFFNLSRGYTAIVSAAAAVFTGIFIFPSVRRMITVNGLIYLAAGMMTFLIFNSLLTGLPVLIYGQTSITGIRIGPIPVEDFAYNYVLLGGYLIAYRFLGIRR
jgi:lycopene cyclase domain-containing protein